MNASTYHTRPLLALAFAIFRGTNAETAINFVGGLKERGTPAPDRDVFSEPRKRRMRRKKVRAA